MDEATLALVRTTKLLELTMSSAKYFEDRSAHYHTQSSLL
jgi:hypothetical protein